MNRMQPHNLTYPTIHNDGVLTIKESCLVLKVGATKLYELINSGALEVIYLGNRSTRVKRRSIDRLLVNGLGSGANTSNNQFDREK